MKNAVDFPLTGGFDRSITSLRADRKNFYRLLNLRPAESEFGRLEQTPYFRSRTLSAGTYWNGSTSATEPGTSSIRGSLTTDAVGLFVTDYVIRTSIAQVQVVYQTAFPAGTGLTKYCLAVFNGSFDLGLGEAYDVEIDSATTFRWRKAGGAWNTGVTITKSGVAVDSGKLVLYFLADSGFTTSDLWTWTRTDKSVGPVLNSTVSGYPVQGYTWRGNIYFFNPDGQLMVKPSAGPIRSVGYKPIYGCSMQIFRDHLFVLNAVKDDNWTNSLAASKNVYNSDLNDFDNFVPTDVNEADEFTFPDVVSIQDSRSGYISLMGAAIIGDYIFIFSGSNVYYSTYLGLPLVFSFTTFNTFPTLELNAGGDSIIQADRGCYIVRADGLWYFDGNQFTKLSYPTGLTSFGTILYGVYSAPKQQVMIYATRVEDGVAVRRLLVYSETTRLWYERNAYFTQDVKSLTYASVGVRFTAANLTYYEEDTTFNYQPTNDNNGSITEPQAIFHLVSAEGLHYVKETEACYLSANVRDEATGNTPTYYTINEDVEIEIGWYQAPNGVLGSYLTHANAIWTSAKPNGLVSFPRTSFRAIAMSLKLKLVDSKPPAFVDIYSFLLFIYDSASKPEQ